VRRFISLPLLSFASDAYSALPGESHSDVIVRLAKSEGA
jgi:hypothetical protein